MITIDDLRRWYTYDPIAGVVCSRLRTSSKRLFPPVPVRAKYLKVKGVWIALAKIAWSLHHGRMPEPGMEIDHADRNSDNNKIGNLREATHTQNDQNRLRPPPLSGYKGVTNTKGRWQARITVNGRTLHLGMFDSADEAHAAYVKAAEKYHGEFMRVHP